MAIKSIIWRWFAINSTISNFIKSLLDTSLGITVDLGMPDFNKQKTGSEVYGLQYKALEDASQTGDDWTMAKSEMSLFCVSKGITSEDYSSLHDKARDIQEVLKGVFNISFPDTKLTAITDLVVDEAGIDKATRYVLVVKGMVLWQYLAQ